MTTITALSSVNDILDSDLVMITHSTGDSYKLSGADLKAKIQAVTAPVNEVTSGNMHSVTSNAVYAALPIEVHHITEKAQSAPATVDIVNILWTKSGKLVTVTGYVHFTGAGGGKVVTGFPNIITGQIAPLSSINTTAGGLLDAEIEDNGLFIYNPASGGGYCRVSGSYVCS